MFSRVIYQNSLTDEVANNLFTNITDVFTPDKSFLATLRVLLHKRLPSNESVALTCHRIRTSFSDMDASTTAECMSLFTSQVAETLPGEHKIHIVYTSHIDAGEKMLEIIRANAGGSKRYLCGYTRLDELWVFYARKVAGLFYSNPDKRSTIIFLPKMEPKHFHALQMMIPKYLPQLFEAKPLTEQEIALLKSTGGKSAEEYERRLAECIRDIDIRTEMIRAKLGGFETSYENARCIRLKDDIFLLESDYETLLNRLRETSEKIQERKYTLAGLLSGQRDTDSELMEYFICNKNLSIISVTGTTINFIAHGYADIYDEEAFLQYAPNTSGFLYQDISHNISPVQMEKLYRAIFSDGIYRLRVCAAYSADMKSGLQACGEYIFPPESGTYFPNTHIQYFRCVGTYRGLFSEYLHKRDYVGAVEQAVISARNLNFYDSTVMGRFAKEFSRTKIKCLEKSDGTLLTPLEAINELEGGALCPGQ
jgi:hypothetical protein